MVSIVEIDGGMGEGGGQILRYALSLSALTQQPVRIINIRARRTPPGLRPQHLTAVKALQILTDAEVSGAEVGSRELLFKPRVRRFGRFSFNIGTAGSVSLVIQAILPTLLFSKGFSEVEIIGGTDVEWSPPIDYMKHVFQYNLKPMGVEMDIQLFRRGHYPKGGGRVLLRVKPLEKLLNPIEKVMRGEIITVKGVSHAVKLPGHVAARQAESASKIIVEKLGLKPEITVETYPPEHDPHLGPGSGILLYAETSSGSRIGSDSLGAKGKRAEVVGEEAAERLLEELSTGYAYDRHMGDMFIPYMFLASGRSVIGVSYITLHTLTAIMVSTRFIPEARVNVVDGEGRGGRIIVDGVGFSP